MSGSRAKARRQDRANAERRLRGEESDLHKLLAFLRYPGTHAQAAAIPKKKTGRPRKYPDYMPVVFAEAISVYRSARKVEAEFANPIVWRELRRTAEETFPDDPSKWLPAEPMRRHHFTYAKEYLANPDVLARLLETFRESSSGLARSIGNADPNGPRSVTHPDLSRVLHGDGKVITPLYKAKPGDFRVDKRTGEIHYLRFDPDATDHREGGGEIAPGIKFMMMSTRSDIGRVMLDVAHVPPSGGGGEAGVATESLRRIVALNPNGYQAVVYDMAMRGTHVDENLRDLGLITISRVPAKEHHLRKGQRRGRRVPKTTLIEVRTVKGPGGVPEPISLVARDGALGILGMNDRGEPLFEPLRRVRTQVNEDKDTYRGCNHFELPPRYETRTIMIPLITSEEDRARGLNRAENLRAIPPGDPDFDRLFALRADAESINRHVEDTLYLNRAHSVGHLGQLLDMLAFGLMVNARTWDRATRERQRLKAA